MLTRFITYSREKAHIAPLAVFRILFGFMMLASIIRFWLNGWIYDLYIAPRFYFTYYGFEWVKPLGESGMYAVFGLMAAAAMGIALGYKYRLSATLFFLSFTYVELIDKTNYLNHYYFVSIIAFLLIFLPAGSYLSLDARHKGTNLIYVPRWVTGTIRLQLALVYLFAGIAKLNPDWLFEAMPLKIWLPSKADMPLIGGLFDYPATAYAASWFGALYDLSIPFLLLYRPTRLIGYGFVLIFHLLTALLFQIGMFPYIMAVSTLIFFTAETQLGWIRKIFRERAQKIKAIEMNTAWKPLMLSVLALHFLFQVIIPFRHTFYPDKLFWTEEGYRFSWRVMLMEKAGHVTFHIADPATGAAGEVMNRKWLTPNQEKMMSTQPDMILQFANHLATEYRKEGITYPVVTAEAYVTLNGSGSRLFLDSTVNLALEQESFKHKNWILSSND